MAANNSSRGNLLQTIVLSALLFLGFQLMCNTQNAARQPFEYQGRKLATVEDYRGALLDANAKLLDVTANSLKTRHDAVVDDLQKTGKLKEEDAKRAKTEAAVVVADAQYKAGVARNDTGRIRFAYQTLVSHWTKERDAKYWRNPVPVQADKRGSLTGQWTPEGLYDKTVLTLSERNRSDQIWGVIPGGYYLIDGLVALTGRIPAFSYAFAGFLLALVVRAIVFPLSQKQIMYSRYMGQLSPRLKEIKEEFGDDQMEVQRRTMELYRKYGINPMAGCFPALVQLPLFLTVYQCMLLYQFEFQKGTFLWINKQNGIDTHGFIAANLGQQDYILIGIYGVSMVISTMLQPITDPTQAKQQRAMGVGVSVLFTIMMFTGAFPVVAGFVLYWTFTNILATAQSLRAYRLPIPPLTEVQTPVGGVRPGAGGKWQQRMQEMMEQAQRAQQERQDDEGGSGGVGARRPATSPKGPKSAGGTEIIPPKKPGSTGTPAKHKPKKRS